jgi:hypothetical protein
MFWTNLKIKITDDFDSLESMLLTGIFSPFFFSPLFSFIENFGTHVVTSATIGGRDVVYIRQHQSSPLSALEIESYVNEIMDQRFLDSKGESSAGPLKYKDKVSIWCCSFETLSPPPLLPLSLSLKNRIYSQKSQGAFSALHPVSLFLSVVLVKFISLSLHDLCEKTLVKISVYCCRMLL